MTRNVTWNLPRPDLAYKEWLRVLKPGGVLYNFDADWYGHLYNEEKRSGYEKDRQQTEEQNVEDYYSGTDIEKMEEIARQVPLSRLERPKWDLDTMKKTGFLDVFCDENVWKEVWTEEELSLIHISVGVPGTAAGRSGWGGIIIAATRFFLSSCLFLYNFFCLCRGTGIKVIMVHKQTSFRSRFITSDVR